MNFLIVISCCLLRDLASVVFNVQWKNVKVFLIVLRAVEIHEILKNIFQT